MRILIISDEVWNDKIHGNNVLSNWFDGFDAEFANIYCSPGQPINTCCNKYFQITDSMMMKSIISSKKAGKAFKIENMVDDSYKVTGDSENKKLYAMLKSITTETLRAIREIIWSYGKYDVEAMKRFIQDFEPDIIFSPRLATIKLLRIEKIVLDIAKVPIVAFTGDAEYSMKLLRISPVFWIKKLIIRRKIREMMPNYSLYYTLSDEQKEEYENEFGCNIKILRKCGDFTKLFENKEVNEPIKIIYAGKLYSNRWKTLVQIVKALKKINKVEIKMILEIYTKDKLTKHQMKLLDDGTNSFVKGAVLAEELEDIYKKADIALHVESFDLKNRLLTRVSFSTKIIDCLASSCAVMAICWGKHSGYTYLNKENAAFTVCRKNNIYTMLKRISDNPDLIKEYAIKAYNCGVQNHKKGNVQQMLFDDFTNIMKKD